MFQIKRMVVHAAMSVALVGGSANAIAATYTVLGGSFHFGDSAVITSLTSAGNLVENSYQGSNVTASTAFFSEAADEYGLFLHPFTAGPAAAPTIDLESMTADLRSFNVAVGIDYNQGGIATVSHLSGNDYQLNWSSLFTPVNIGESAAYDGMTGVWTMNVRAPSTVVPLPAAVWLMGSGLIGFAGFARRRKSGN